MYRPRKCQLSVEARRVLIKAVRMPIVIVGEPKEAARVYNTHGLNNTLTVVRKFL